MMSSSFTTTAALLLLLCPISSAVAFASAPSSRLRGVKFVQEPLPPAEASEVPPPPAAAAPKPWSTKAIGDAALTASIQSADFVDRSLQRVLPSKAGGERRAREALGAIFARLHLQGSQQQQQQQQLAEKQEGVGDDMYDVTPAQKSKALEERFWDQLISVVLTVVVALLWYFGGHLTPAVNDGNLMKVKDRDFEHGLCTWYQEPLISLCACCCPAIVWGDNLNAVGHISFFHGYRPTFWSCFFLYLVSQVIWGNIGLTFLGFFGFLIVDLLMGWAYAQVRWSMRERFGMSRTQGEWWSDCLVWQFCCCCALVQEARQVKTLTGSPMYVHNVMGSTRPMY